MLFDSWRKNCVADTADADEQTGHRRQNSSDVPFVRIRYVYSKILEVMKSMFHLIRLAAKSGSSQVQQLTLTPLECA